jgi:hypothetical protein
MREEDKGLLRREYRIPNKECPIWKGRFFPFDFAQG